MFATVLTIILYIAIIGGIYWLTTLLPIPQPFGQIMTVLFVILAIVVVLAGFGIISGGLPRIHL